ncbi:MAG TPA: carboxypeptidase regulatory-like domain-containing protein, partial [Terriglobus sp.]
VITTPLSAQAQALLQYIPLPNTTTTGTSSTNENYNYQRIATIGSNSSQISARFTRQLGSSATQGLGGRFGGGARGGGNARQQGPATLRQNISVNFAYSHSASDSRGLIAALDGKTVSNGYNLGAGYQLGYGRLSNSFTLGWNRSRGLTTNNFTNGPLDPAGAAGISIPKPVTAQQGLYYGVPLLSFTNFTSVSDTQPADRLQEVFSLSDFVSWRHGKHNFRFGFDGRRQHLDMIAGGNGLGSFSFTGYATQAPTGSVTTASPSGSAFADFLLGAPQTTAIQAGGNKIYLREWIYDFYVQDDYRVRRDLTLNYGLRYEYFSPYIEENNRLVNLDHNADFTEYARVVSGGSGTYSGSFPRSLINPNRTLWSPRIGVAWNPKWVKNTVVRAGYGINFNVGQYANFANSLSYQQPFAQSQNNTAKVASTDQGCGNITTPGSSSGSLFTLANGFNCTSSSILQNTFAVNKDYRLGRVQVFNFDIQHTFPLGIVTNVGYNGSLGGNLDLRRSPNRTATSIVGNAQSIVYEDSIGDSRFHALSVNARKRLQKGVSLQATYQYGHSIDDASSINTVGNNTIVQNDKRIDLEYGNSSFDVRHKVNGNFLYELPFGPNRAFLSKGGKLSKALDNFGISGNFTFATGTYTTPQYQNTVAQAAAGNNFTLRPDRDFSQPIAGAGTLRSWFNPKAFTTPSPSVVFGTASRNSIELPGTVSVSMSLSKSIPLGELRNFEGRITAANVFNTAQYTSVNAVLNSSTFGQVNGVSSPRKLTFDARYRF